MVGLEESRRLPTMRGMAEPGAEVVLGTLPGMGREMRELEREALGERREEEDVFPIVGGCLGFGCLRGLGLG